MNWVWQQPGWIAVATLAVPMGLLAWRWFSSMSRVRRLSAVLLRTVLLGLLGVGLAGLMWSENTERLAVIGVVDVSDSVQRFSSFGPAQAGGIDQAAAAFFTEASQDRDAEDMLGLVAFAADPVAIALPTTADPTDRALTFASASGTDAGSALRLAAAMIPPGATGRLVLLSDGNETDGDMLAAAAELAGENADGAGGLTIDVVPLRYRVGREVAVEALEAPPLAGVESTVSLRVVLRATEPAAGRITVLLNGDPVDANGPADGFARRVTLGAGRTVVPLPVALGPGRVHRFEAVFEPDADTDTSLANNRGESFTVTPGRGRVLLASQAEDNGELLAGTLQRLGLDVVAVNATGVPNTMLGLQGYDVVLLDNVSVEFVPDAKLELLDEWVRRFGGGLIVLGGLDALGSGGWRDTLMEELLPVGLDLPVREVMPEAAVVFVIDKSGSMGYGVLGSSRTQQQIANEATGLAIRLLDENDLVGVIAFSDREREVVRLAPNNDSEATSAAVRSIGPGGATNLPPALRLAIKRLREVDAKDRQIVVLTDGQSENSEQLLPIAQGLNDANIRLNTIAIGDEADVSLLRNMAAAGGGAFYRVSRPEALPAVLMKAVRVQRSPQVREGAFTPIVAEPLSPLVAGFAELPPLGGLSLTMPRDEPTVTTSVVTDRGEPVLADWPVELGRVVVFASDASRWAEPWIDTPTYAAFWGQLVRSVTRSDEQGGGELRVAGDGRVLRLDYQALDPEQRPLDGLAPTARLYGPNNSKIDVALRQRGPGAYSAEAIVPDAGAWIAVASAESNGRPIAPAFGGATVSAGGELAALESNESVLRAIAETTGGRVLELDDPANARLFDRGGVLPRIALEAVWPTLIAWAIVVFLLDVATRKIAWDRFVSADFGSGLMQRARHAVAGRGEAATATVGGLRSGRDEAGSVADRLRAASAASNEVLAAETDRDTRRARQEALREAAAKKRDELRAAKQASPPAEVNLNQQPKKATKIDTQAKPSQDANADEPGGLLAAKRRAQQRYEDQNEN